MLTHHPVSSRRRPRAGLPSEDLSAGPGDQPRPWTWDGLLFRGCQPRTAMVPFPTRSFSGDPRGGGRWSRSTAAQAAQPGSNRRRSPTGSSSICNNPLASSPKWQNSGSARSRTPGCDTSTGFQPGPGPSGKRFHISIRANSMAVCTDQIALREFNHQLTFAHRPPDGICYVE